MGDRIWSVLFGQTGLFRALAVAVVLLVLCLAVMGLVRQNVSEQAARPAAAIAVLAVVGWALWNPTSSERRLWFFGGIYGAARVGKYIGVVGMVVVLLWADFRLADWLRPALPYVATLIVCLVLERLFVWRLESGHRASGADSVLLRNP